MKDEKRALRSVLRERRRGLPAAVVEAAGVAVCTQLRAFPPYQAARAVLAYVANENEIPTAPLLPEIISSGRELYLPHSKSGEQFVRWRPGEPLITGPGGVSEPLAGAPLRADGCVVALIPVVGWDESGMRLGRGGGFYDRIFTGLSPEVVRVGLAYEFQQVAELPREPWDVSLDYVITERRIVRCDRAGSSSTRRPASLRKGGLQL
jgi:5-formyltetrahydrofolate cyclo-ligase